MRAHVRWRIIAALMAAFAMLIPSATAQASGSSAPTLVIQDLHLDTAPPTYVAPNLDAAVNTYGSFMAVAGDKVESFAGTQVNYRNPVMVESGRITATLPHRSTRYAPYWTARFWLKGKPIIEVNVCTIDPTWESRSRPGNVTFTAAGDTLVSCTWATNRHLGGFYVSAQDNRAPKTSRGLALAKSHYLGFRTTPVSFQSSTDELVNLRAQINPDTGNVLTKSGDRLFAITAKTITGTSGEPTDARTNDATVTALHRPSPAYRFTELAVSMTGKLTKAPFVLEHTQATGLDLYTHGTTIRTVGGGYLITSVVPVGTRLMSLDIYGVLPGLKVIAPVSPLPMDGVHLS